MHSEDLRVLFYVDTIHYTVGLYFLLYKINDFTQVFRLIQEIRKIGFKNEVFATLEHVVNRLCETICSLTLDTIKSITGRSWILSCFR